MNICRKPLAKTWCFLLNTSHRRVRGLSLLQSELLLLQHLRVGRACRLHSFNNYPQHSSAFLSRYRRSLLKWLMECVVAANPFTTPHPSRGTCFSLTYPGVWGLSSGHKSPSCGSISEGGQGLIVCMKQMCGEGCLLALSQANQSDFCLNWTSSMTPGR